jgi:hypothetical protein
MRMPFVSSELHLRRSFVLIISFVIICAPLAPAAAAQDILTGAFSGRVSSTAGDAPVAGATIRFIDKFTGITRATRSDGSGNFYKGSLPSSTYTIEVEAAGFQLFRREQQLVSIRTSNIVPLPVKLTPLNAATDDKPKPADPKLTQMAPPPTAIPSIAPVPGTLITDSVEVTSSLDSTDGRRGGAYVEGEVASLPLGGASMTRTFDELALLLPGVAPPPQTAGNISGPGVGPGVGSSGQFSVNGLRSRANNFTVDGSDNNDEDIGVRRQGFLSLVPQSIESIREYQIITALAPAQLGRNLGAQVNAISKSGSTTHHGTFYSFLNTSELNARDFFDRSGGDVTSPLRIGNRPVILCDPRLLGAPNALTNCLFDNGTGGTPITTRLNTGGKDSLTLFQPGIAIGGPIPRFGQGGRRSYQNLFYFLSAEGQILNANKETNFAVPTVQDRGAFESGASGLFTNPIPEFGGSQNFGFPTTLDGDAIFSLFPFANNPGGVYGARTFTQVLPANANGRVISAKIDVGQMFAGRYNFTDDDRQIPTTGGALFSGLISRVRTQNLSLYMNRELSGPNATKVFSNQFRFSYGRTRLNFDERRDTEFLLPTSVGLPNRLQALANEPFFLNARYLTNYTLPTDDGVPNITDPIIYRVGDGPLRTTMEQIGPIGQLNIAGFSPIGTDVFNFPQRRVNNTYQIADTLSGRIMTHSFAVGADIRRTDLNSDLPRNSRPLVYFTGAPRLIPRFNDQGNLVELRYPRSGDPFPFFTPATLAAANAPSNVQLSISTGPDASIHLRNYQTNFFGQDEWRIRPNLTLSYGLRYEYNTVPHETDNKIEKTFNDPLIAQALPGLQRFLDGRTKIYEDDRNNFAPRLGLAYAINSLGPNHTLVIRGGYGRYYDQIIGAVISQSRNVFPSFLTSNLGGGPDTIENGYQLFNPFFTRIGDRFIIAPRPGLPNRLNTDQISVADFISISNDAFPPAFGATLPAKNLRTPFAHQYSLTLEQQLSANHFVSAGYVGTLGRQLLRFTTPNLGQNSLILPFFFAANDLLPFFAGFTVPPGTILSSNGIPTGGRPVAGLGAINQFETTAESRYDSLQVQLRGRFAFHQNGLQYQASYTFAKAIDEVSDVFDLAGAPALPQRSCLITQSNCNYDNERGVANFDVRHRFTYSLMYSFPAFTNGNRVQRFLLGGIELAGTGQVQTGQPFTVNSTIDVNLDGNLTDRLNSLNGIVETGDRRQLLRLAPGTSLFSLLASPSQDGRVGRNTFRASNYILLNMALVKNFVLSDRQRVIFRAEFFNFPNRANFAIPVRFLEAPGFGSSTETITPGRRIQFALKYAF